MHIQLYHLSRFHSILLRFSIPSSRAGDNDCTEDTSPCPSCTGFTAAKGFDPATGWGVPLWDVMAKLVAALP